MVCWDRRTLTFWSCLTKQVTPVYCTVLYYCIKRITSSKNWVHTVVFNIGNVCHTDKAWVLNSVDPEQEVNKCTVCTGRNSWQAAHVVVIVDKSNGKPRCRVQCDTHTPYVPLRSDTRNCTYRRNGVAYLQQYIRCSGMSCVHQRSSILTAADAKHLQRWSWMVCSWNPQQMTTFIT